MCQRHAANDSQEEASFGLAGKLMLRDDWVGKWCQNSRFRVDYFFETYYGVDLG